MIPIQTLARESFIREHGDLLRELRNFLKSFLQLSLTEFLGPRRDMGRLFEQAGHVRVNVNAVSASMTAQFFLNVRLDINNDSHLRGLSPITPRTAHSLSPW